MTFASSCIQFQYLVIPEVLSMMNNLFISLFHLFVVIVHTDNVFVILHILYIRAKQTYLLTLLLLINHPRNVSIKQSPTKTVSTKTALCFCRSCICDKCFRLSISRPRSGARTQTHNLCVFYLIHTPLSHIRNHHEHIYSTERSKSRATCPCLRHQCTDCSPTLLVSKDGCLLNK